MNISFDALAALVASLVVALIPLPRRAEGLRVGVLSAVLAFLVVDSTRKRGAPDVRLEAAEQPAAPARTAKSAAALAVPAAPADLTSVDEDVRLNGTELLTDFSILRHLRRTGAVSDSEFAAKKVNILRRV